MEKKYKKKAGLLIRDDLYTWLKKEAKKNGYMLWRQLEVILEDYKERHEK